MKLDRNINKDGKGKYALIKLRGTSLTWSQTIPDSVFVPGDAIDFGDTPDTEFFVIRLKDKYAAPALAAYAKAVAHDDPEYALEINNLAERSLLHPSKRKPD